MSKKYKGFKGSGLNKKITKKKQLGHDMAAMGLLASYMIETIYQKQKKSQEGTK